MATKKPITTALAFLVALKSLHFFAFYIQGGAKKRGHQPSYLTANIPKTP